MAERPTDPKDPEQPKAKPPVVPPVARPVVPPAVRPVVPPAAPPVVPPVAPPAVPPVAPPVARPVVPPTAPPVAAPTVPPVAPPVVPPTAVKPVVAPAAPPPVRPTAAPVVPPASPPKVAPVGAATPRRGGRGRRDAEAEPSRAGRGREAAAPRSTGLGVGPKVGLVTALLAILCVLLAAQPWKRDDSAGAARAAFQTAGLNAAVSLGAGLAGVERPAAGPAPAGKALDALVQILDGQIKTLNPGGSLRARSAATVAALRGALAGKTVSGDIKKLVDEVDAAIKKEEEDEAKAALRAERERLIQVDADLSGAASAGPAETGPGGLSLPTGTLEYAPVAVWLTEGSKAVAQAPKNAPALDTKAPGATVGQGRGWIEQAVDGREATVFYAPASAGTRVWIAFETPAFPSGGGSALALLMLVLAPVLVGGVGWLMAAGHAKPLQDLARELDRLGSTGDPGRRIAAQGPEAGAIARSVERMVANLKFRSQHEMSDLQEVISKEQGNAAQLHQSLMPRNPPRIPNWEVETLFKPGFELAGDHFDYFRIDDSHLGVIIMDASVRGIAAAVVMSMARAYVHAYAAEVHSPAEVLVRVNRSLAADLSQGQYVTALYVVIDTAASTAKVASAGHLPLVVYRAAARRAEVVNPEGVALGLDAGPVFERSMQEADVAIGPGDRLVLHTDGAVNVQNETGEEFGEARLYEAIQQKAPMNSQAFVNFVGSGIDQFHLTTPQNDDITISTVKRLK